MGNNLERIAQTWTPPTIEEINRCIKKDDSIPQLDPNKLNTEFILGASRSLLQTVTSGDASLFLRYVKRGTLREGFDLSLEENPGDELQIVQLKGGKPAGLRIDQGLNVARFMAEQTRKIADHPDSSVRFITMPHTLELLRNKTAISNYNEHGETRDVARYKAFADYLGMSWSESESKYIKEVFREPQTPVVVFQV